MLKRYICVIIFTMSLLFLLTSCSLSELTLGLSDRILDERLSEDKHNIIEVIWGEDDWYESIVYSEKNYYMDKHEIFSVTDVSEKVNESDVILSWNGFRFGYIDSYYSYTNDAPIFIYETRLKNIYFREDYDYMTDVFEIEGSEIKVSISELVDFDNEVWDYSALDVVAEFTLVSQTNTRIKCKVSICQIGDVFYSYVGSYPYYRMEIKQNTLQKLKENGIIN